jgi:hypothetical protein
LAARGRGKAWRVGCGAVMDEGGSDWMRSRPDRGVRLFAVAVESASWVRCG